MASVRAVNLLVETDGTVGGLALSLTPDLMNLRKRARLDGGIVRKSL